MVGDVNHRVAGLTGLDLDKGDNFLYLGEQNVLKGLAWESGYSTVYIHYIPTLFGLLKLCPMLCGEKIPARRSFYPFEAPHRAHFATSEGFPMGNCET